MTGTGEGDQGQSIEAAWLRERQKAERRRAWRKAPRRIDTVLSQVLSRRGYARVRGDAALSQVWAEAAGARFAGATRPGRLRRGELEILVNNSVVLQEMSLGRAEIVARIRKLVPEAQVERIRFRQAQLGDAK